MEKFCSGDLKDVNITTNPQHRAKLKQITEKLIDFRDKNRVSSIIFNCTILKFFEKFGHPFSHVFIFGNMLPESHSCDAVPVAK